MRHTDRQDTKPDEQAMTVRIPRTLHDYLRERAFKERRHMSDLIREALEAQFGRREPPAEFAAARHA